MRDVLDTLTERMQWYRDGCPFLEDRDGYFASGDLARDAASDLEAALAEIRTLESVIVQLRETLSVRRTFVDAVGTSGGKATTETNR